MASDFDPYHILEVDPSADQEEIESAYERLARRYESEDDHRGRHERLRELRTAYAMLRDPEQRRAYDERRAGRAPAAVAELRVEPAAPPRGGRAPWGISDMLKAIGIVIVGTMAVSIPAALLAVEIAGGADDIEDDPSALSIVLGASLVLEVLLLFTAFRFSVWKYRLSWSALGLRMPDRGGWLFPMGLLMGSLGIIYVYFGVLDLFGIEPDTDIPEQAFDSLAPALILGVLSLGFAPLMEEVFFRGFVFGGLRGRWGLVLAALASGLLFGLAHIGNTGTLWVVPPIGLVGALFAWGYAYSGSLLAPIIAHFLFNLVAYAVGLAGA